MITDAEATEEFERELIRSTPADYLKNLAMAEAMYEEAVARGFSRRPILGTVLKQI